MPVEKISVSFMPEVLEAIEARARTGERSTQISRCLDRYFAALGAERGKLRELFDDAETGLIVDVFNGVAFWDTISVRLAWANVADGIEMDGLDKKWKVADAPGLIAKVKGLDLAATCALVDAVEIWWNRVADGKQPQPTADEVFGHQRTDVRYPYSET